MAQPCPSAPAQGSRWRTRDTHVGISLGAVFVHGWAPFHNRGCGIKAFAEAGGTLPQPLCHARSSETGQCNGMQHSQGRDLSPPEPDRLLPAPPASAGSSAQQEQGQGSSSLLREAVVESGEPAASTCHCYHALTVTSHHRPALQSPWCPSPC